MRRARSDDAKDERRQALIAAALDAFYENGFAAARLDDIAARAGLSKGAVYLYFDSKEALFRAIFETVALPRVRLIEEIARNTGSAEEAIAKFGALGAQIVEQTPLPKILKVLIGDGAHFPDAVDAYRREVIERALGALTELLARAQERGELSVGDPAMAARLVIAPFLLSAIWRVAFEERASAESAFDYGELLAAHARIFLNGVRPRPTSGQDADPAPDQNGEA